MSKKALSLQTSYMSELPLPPLSPMSEAEPLNASPVKISEYESLRNAFLLGQVSYTRQLILRKMARKSFLLSKMGFTKSYYLHNWVADTLLMTEIELLYWGVLLQNTGINDRHMRPRCILLLTGYLAKLGLTRNIEPYQDLLLSKFPNFIRDFEGWALGTDCYTDFSVEEVNRLLSLLTYNKKNKRDYEHLVSSVLKRANNRDPFKSDSSTIGEQDIYEFKVEEYSFLDNISD